MSFLFSSVGVKAVAAVVPSQKFFLKSLSESFGEQYVKRTIKFTGIDSVHIASKDKTTADYCVNAAKRLFADNVVDSQTIDAVVFVSQTPDYIIPHTSAIIQDKLGLRNDIVTLDINYGCAGYIYGLLQAYMLVSSGCRNVLLFCGDTLSKHVNEKDKSLRMVLGDAATVTLVSAADKGKAVFDFYCDGSHKDDLIIPAGGNRTANTSGITDAEKVDADGNCRSLQNLYMNGMAVMNFALGPVAALIDKNLVAAGWSKDDVDLFVFHQANKTIVQYLGKTIGLNKDKLLLSLRETGNTSSASIPLALCKEYGGKELNLSKINLCGFGTGLAAGSICLNMKDVKILSVEEV